MENEYGSFGSDKGYMIQMRDIIAEYVGSNAILYTTDGAAPGYFIPGQVPGALTTIDFGPGSTSSFVVGLIVDFQRLKLQYPGEHAAIL